MQMLKFKPQLLFCYYILFIAISFLRLRYVVTHIFYKSIIEIRYRFIIIIYKRVKYCASFFKINNCAQSAKVVSPFFYHFFRHYYALRA